MSEAEAVKIHRGLKGVYFERSGVSSIDGKIGELRYRGYSIHDLAKHSTFEETAYLLLNGELPDGPSLERFRQELIAGRQLPGPILEHHRDRQGGTSDGRAPHRGLGACGL